MQTMSPSWEGRVRLASSIAVALVLVCGSTLAVRAANHRAPIRQGTVIHPVALAAIRLSDNRSRVVETAVPSAVLHRQVPLRLFIPAGVRPGKRYASILLLHGNPGGDDDFFAHGLSGAIDHAIARHEIPPVFAIAPDGNAGANGDSEWLDGPEGAIETFVFDELMPVLDKQLPLSPSRSAHAIWGISMGGYGALNLGYRHPGAFSAVVSFSGYAVADGTIYAAGTPLGDANSPQLLAAASGPRVATMLAEGGDADLPGFAAQNRTLATTLKSSGATVELHEEQAPHSWTYWTRLFPSALAFIGQKIRPGSP